MPTTYFVSRLEKVAQQPKPLYYVPRLSVSPPYVSVSVSRPGVSPTVSQAKGKLRTPHGHLASRSSPSSSPLPVRVHVTDPKGRRRILCVGPLVRPRRVSASPSPSPDPQPLPVYVRNKYTGFLEIIRPFPLVQARPVVHSAKVRRWCP